MFKWEWLDRSSLPLAITPTTARVSAPATSQERRAHPCPFTRRSSTTTACGVTAPLPTSSRAVCPPSWDPCPCCTMMMGRTSSKRTSRTWLWRSVGAHRALSPGGNGSKTVQRRQWWHEDMFKVSDWNNQKNRNFLKNKLKTKPEADEGRCGEIP